MLILMHFRFLGILVMSAVWAVAARLRAGPWAVHCPIRGARGGCLSGMPLGSCYQVFSQIHQFTKFVIFVNLLRS